MPLVINYLLALGPTKQSRKIQMTKKLPLKTRIENYFLALTPEKIKQCLGAKEVIAQIKRERKLGRKERNHV